MTSNAQEQSKIQGIDGEQAIQEQNKGDRRQ